MPPSCLSDAMDFTRQNFPRSLPYGDYSESERVVAVLDIDALAAVAADAVVRRGAACVAAVDDNGLSTFGACNGDRGRHNLLVIILLTYEYTE